MNGWVIAGIVTVLVFALLFVAQRMRWIDLRGTQHSGSAGGGGIAGVASIGDEVFHPTKHEAQAELDRQAILPAPAPLPGDPAWAMPEVDDDNDDDRFRGKVTLQL